MFLRGALWRLAADSAQALVLGLVGDEPLGLAKETLQLLKHSPVFCTVNTCGMGEG